MSDSRSGEIPPPVCLLVEVLDLSAAHLAESALISVN